MDVVKGRLTAGRKREFSNFRVGAFFEQRLVLDELEDDLDDRFFPARTETIATAEGRFSLEIPDLENRRGPIRVVALGPDGLLSGSVEVEADGALETVKILVSDRDITVVSPSSDITLGEKIKYTGRAIDADGRGLAADLLVVLWAQDDDNEPSYPLSVTRTSANGYFSGPWIGDRFSRVFARVSGSAPAPILLEDGRLPRQLILVVGDMPKPTSKKDDCACDKAPPRAPDEIDVAQNSAAYAQDAERCVDFTVPNRTVETLSYYAVVRTTQPELKAADPPNPPKISPVLIQRLVELARLRPTDIQVLPGPAPSDSEAVAPSVGGFVTGPVAMSVAQSRSRLTTFEAVAEGSARSNILDAAVQKAALIAPGISLDGRFLENASKTVEVRSATEPLARQVLTARTQTGTPLELGASVLAELAREPGDITPQRLLEAEQTSIVRRFRGSVDLLARPKSGRFQLDDKNQIDWDEIPEAFQATTIAHGHLLQMKQVWRADGYSLGDLLYSLPLAPGQQKLISVLDWNREEVATRRAQREVAEAIEADLSRDRDISDIIRSSLSERMNATSHADTSAVGGGIGGFVGTFVFGAAGGVASAGSTASQTSGRGVTGLALNRVRDRTLQSASAVRSQRATVVQSARQGETVRAQTEVVANYNHCHAVTMEYFEVLRHLQVSQELARVQECLFIPFSISSFSAQKALRWREPLQRWLRSRRWHPAFDALERVQTSWEATDFPNGRYADEQLLQLDGEFRLRMSLPRPSDSEAGDFLAANWAGYLSLLWDSAQNIWERYLGVALPAQRNRIWDTRIAPGVAQRLLEQLSIQLIGNGPGAGVLSIDPTLVSRFQQDSSLLVGVRANAPLPLRLRSQVSRVRLSLSAMALPPGAEILVESASLNYRTAHLNHSLFSDRRVLNDLTTGDVVEITTPLSVVEKRNPRARDRRYAERLLEHLDEHVEYYHRAIWFSMDPNRRFMLLDGFIAPDAGGRSVASVVENQVIGIVGNSLVMPVSPGQKLDSTYEFAKATPEDLRHLYSANPAPPMRISLPTSGVFAEAVAGACNSCETIDDTRFWRWEEAPIPDQPSLIAPLSLDSRRQAPPTLAPDALPDSLVRLQTAPDAPDPTGLAAAVKSLGANNIFKDLTGLALNQQNAAKGLTASIKAGQSFASKAGALAQQQFLNRELDRNLDHIKSARDSQLITPDQARSLTESVLRGAIGEARPQSKSPTKSAAVKRAIERVSKATSGTLRVTRPEGTVEIKQGIGSSRTPLLVAIDPDIIPIQQHSSLTCWAAGGAMMAVWRARQSLSIETVLGGVGGDWRDKFDRNEGLRAQELRAFLAALNLVEDAPQSYTPEGLARLLAAKGPLLEVGDDSIENNLVVHIRIIAGVKGDGRLEGTTVRLADSVSGQIIPAESFANFDRRHGATDSVSFGVGLFHF